MKKSLLIIDDAMIIREMLKGAARLTGWEVIAEGTNGLEGAELYRQYRPSVVTLDLVMPEYNGLYALEKIRDFDPNAIVIVVSALNQQTKLKEAFRLGASDFIVKPFSSEDVLTTLEAYATAPSL